MNRLKIRKRDLKIFALTGQILLIAAHWACGQSTFTTTGGSQSWGTPGSWSPNGVPSGTDAAVVFNSPGAAQTVTLGANRTIGSLTIHDTAAATANTILFSSTGGYTLTISAASGTGTVLVDGTGVAVDTMSSTVVLTSSLDVTVSNTSVTSSSGAITFTGAMTGAGNFIKDGDGTSSMTSTAKAYTGATTVNAGVLRMTATGEATGTSSLTVNSGGQLRLDASGSAFLIGSSASTVITLNGTGDANLSGNNGTGALANYGGGTSTLANVIQLASASSVYTTTTLTLNGAISGSGSLTKVGSGTVNLATANGYTGGTTVSAGTLYANAGVSGTSSATGTGSVTVSGGNLGGSGNISGAVSVTSGTLLGGSGSTGTALTISNDLTMSSGSIIGLTLGASGAHSTLTRGGGNWTFDPSQQFTVSGSPAVGFYDNVITGLAADPGSESSWTITNSGFVETFTYDGGTGPGNIDLTITAVPEPATVFAGLLMVGALGWNQRRRLHGLAAG